uniref:G_PROTEIN_RECEP_F1_2 domain-containing protein n=1 Tax=Mesocestoides corti TaxID=53468 RepID=A0A5K3F1A8_MESCO
MNLMQFFFHPKDLQSRISYSRSASGISMSGSGTSESELSESSLSTLNSFKKTTDSDNKSMA